MSTETNQEADAAKNVGEGEQVTAAQLEAIRKELEDSKATIGSLKRDLKDAQKAKETQTPEKTTTEPSDLDYGQKALLRAIGVKGSDELQLAKDYMKRTGLDVDALESDDIFQARLDKLRTTKANELAATDTSNRGSAGGGKNTVDYWLAKGEHPPKELGRELAEQYVEAKRNQGKNAKVFYND